MIARLRWPPVTTGLRWWPDPTGHRPPEIVHGQKPGDEYVRVSVHRRHCWRWDQRIMSWIIDEPARTRASI